MNNEKIEVESGEDAYKAVESSRMSGENAYIQEIEDINRWRNGMMMLEEDIQRFENMEESFKDNPVTERDLYALKLWLKMMIG